MWVSLGIDRSDRSNYSASFARRRDVCMQLQLQLGACCVSSCHCKKLASTCLWMQIFSTSFKSIGRACEISCSGDTGVLETHPPFFFFFSSMHQSQRCKIILCVHFFFHWCGECLAMTQMLVPSQILCNVLS